MFLRASVPPRPVGVQSEIAMAFEPVLTSHVRESNAHTLDFYLKHLRGYEGLRKALTLQPNDVIEQVNGRGVTSVDDLRSALESNGERPALVLVNRQGTNLFFTLRAA